MNNKLTINQKINILIKSSKEYRGVLLMGLLFIFIGGILVFIGLHFDITFLIIFGGIFISFSLFFIIYTIPSSILYYYEKALAAKYGRIVNAYLKDKKVIDNSYYESTAFFDSPRKKSKFINELNYLLIYSFEYKNKIFENSDFVEKNLFEKIVVGDIIPVKFMLFNPNKSSISKTKLKKIKN